MSRRTLVIIASVVVVLGLLVGAYFLFFANATPKLTGVANPFGGSGSNVPDSSSVSPVGAPVQGAGTVVALHLIKITDGPVAKGFAALFIPAATSSLPAASSTALNTNGVTPPSFDDIEVRYIDRASGNVYAYRITARTSTRLSNHTLPGVQEASWLNNGSLAFVRFLEKASDNTEHIDTYALPSSGEGGYFLDKDLEQVLVGSSTIATLLSNNDGSVATLASPDGSNARSFFSSALSSLRIAFAGANLIATTKASQDLNGYSFSVDRTTGSFTQILGPLTGLATLPSPNGKLLFYSYSDRGKVYSQFLDLTTHNAIALPLATLSEKCVWTTDSTALYCGIPTSLSGTLPDDWYQGVTSFTDRIWRIDIDSRTASLVFDPMQLAQVNIDAVGLTLDAQNRSLIFMNKRDGSLWSYSF